MEENDDIYMENINSTNMCFYSGSIEKIKSSNLNDLLNEFQNKFTDLIKNTEKGNLTHILKLSIIEDDLTFTTIPLTDEIKKRIDFVEFQKIFDNINDFYLDKREKNQDFFALFKNSLNFFNYFLRNTISGETLNFFNIYKNEHYFNENFVNFTKKNLNEKFFEQHSNCSVKIHYSPTKKILFGITLEFILRCLEKNLSPFDIFQNFCHFIRLLFGFFLIKIHLKISQILHSCNEMILNNDSHIYKDFLKSYKLHNLQDMLTDMYIRRLNYYVKGIDISKNLIFSDTDHRDDEDFKFYQFFYEKKHSNFDDEYQKIKILDSDYKIYFWLEIFHMISSNIRLLKNFRTFEEENEEYFEKILIFFLKAPYDDYLNSVNIEKNFFSYFDKTKNIGNIFNEIFIDVFSLEFNPNEKIKDWSISILLNMISSRYINISLKKEVQKCILKILNDRIYLFKKEINEELSSKNRKNNNSVIDVFHNKKLIKKIFCFIMNADWKIELDEQIIESMNYLSKIN